MPRAVRRPAAPPQPARRGHSAAAPLDIDALFQKVDAAYRTDPRRAMGLVERALEGLPRHRLAPTEAAVARARLLRIRGHARRNLNDHVGALADYAAALGYFRRAGQPMEMAITQIGRIDALMYRGRYEEALKAAAEARRIFTAAGDRLRAARLESNVGNLYHRWDRPAPALTHYQRAACTFRALGDRHGLALVDFNRGNALAALGRFDEAEAAYQAGRTVFAALGQEMAVAQVDYNRAYLPFLQERLTEALAAFDEVQPRLARLGERRHEALCLMDSAEILLRLNLPVEAEERARRAAAAFRALDMRYEMARSLAFQGMALFRARRLDAARPVWRRSATLFAREGNRVWLGTLALGQARLEMLAGRLAAAGAHARRAEKSFGPQAPPDRRGECLLVQGLLALASPARRGKSATGAAGAPRLLRRALLLARKAGAVWLQRDIEEALGDVARGAGRRSDARAHYVAAVEAGEHLRSLVAGDDFRAAFFRERSRPYLGLAFMELEAGRLEDAWGWVERARARALLEELDDVPRESKNRDARGAADLETLLRRLGSQYHRDVERYALGSRPATEVNRLPDTVRHHLESRAESIMRRLYPEFRDPAPARPMRRPSAANSTGLEADEALVTYVELDGAISAFVRQHDELSVATDLADASTVAAASERLAYQWGRFRLGGTLLRRHARYLLEDTLEDLELLHGLLVAPLRSALASPRLIISPSRSLAAVPFAALFDGQRFLVESHPITIAPSLGVLTRCRQRLGPGGRCALLLGQTGSTTPEVGRELDELAARLAGARVTRLEGAAATVAAYSREAGEAGYIHLASHGFFHTERPRLSGIRLADRWLHAHDVVRQPLKADLVVLSACQSGMSLALEGEEWLGLPRAFLKAGAARVVASLWDVDDRATRELMAHFVTTWWGDEMGRNRVRARAKHPAAEALRAAQIALMRRNRHPYFWAGFQLVGAP